MRTFPISIHKLCTHLVLSTYPQRIASPDYNFILSLNVIVTSVAWLESSWLVHLFITASPGLRSRERNERNPRKCRCVRSSVDTGACGKLANTGGASAAEGRYDLARIKNQAVFGPLKRCEPVAGLRNRAAGASVPPSCAHRKIHAEDIAPRAVPRGGRNPLE